MSSKLLFVCGFPSSGTDLLKNILNAHPEVRLTGEIPFLPSLAAKYGPCVPAELIDELVGDLRRLDVYRNLGDTTQMLPPSRDSYAVADIFSGMISGGQFKWKGSKTPQFTEDVDKIYHMFPDAKVIVIIRDVRDVALSWKRKWGKDELLCAWKWDKRMRGGYDWLHEHARNSFMLVRYESLLQDFEKTVSDICAFLDIEWDERMLEYEKYVGERVEGKLNYGMHVLKKNHGKWRKEMGEARVKRIEEIAWRSLNVFGYPIAEAVEHRAITRLEKYRGVVRDIMALLFVGNRAIKTNRVRNRVNEILFEFKKLKKVGYRN